MKGNSNTQPVQLFRFSDHNPNIQVRWNITREGYVNEYGQIIETWDYEWLNVDLSDSNKAIQDLLSAGCEDAEMIINS